MTNYRTIGHGTLSKDEFAGLLTDANVQTVIDVRRYPGSRRHPHFGRDAMAEWLPAHGVAYEHRPSLGGRRRPDECSKNTGLRNLQFRAYADHMATDEFLDEVSELRKLADGLEDGLIVLLCAESVWWRCHRRLLADHLVLIDGAAVEHLFHDGRSQAHPVTPEATVADSTVVVYPAAARPPRECSE